LEASLAADPLWLTLVLGVGFTLAFAAITRWPAAVVRHAGLVLALLGLVTGLAAVPLVSLDPPGLRLEVDPSTELMLPAHDPAQALYREAVRKFGDDEIFVIAMQTDELFTAPHLRLLQRITDRIARMPEVRRVQSLTDVVAFRYDHQADWLEVTDFIDEVPEDPAALARLRREALGDRMYRRTLVSEDGRTAAVNVTFRKMTDQRFIDSRLDARIRDLLEEQAASLPGVHFHVAGRPHVKDRVYHWMLRDMGRLIPLALLVIAAGLWVVFGTRRGVLLPMAIIVVATLWTFGAIAALGRPLTVLTTLLAPMLGAIGSVYGVHALSRYEEEAREAPDPATAAERTLVSLRLPVLVSGLTTMVGFGALLLTDVPAVFELGAFSVLGVASITLLALAGAPAWLAQLPLRHAGGGTRLSARIARVLDQRLEALASAAARHAGSWLVLFSLLLLVCVAAIPQIRIDTDYLSFFSERAQVRRDFEAVNRLLAGAVPLFVYLRGDAAGSFREPEALAAMQRIQRGAERLPGVGKTLSMVDTVRLMNRAMAKDDPAEDRIPDRRGAVAELLFLAPKGDLERYTDVSHEHANILVRTGAVGTAAVRKVVVGLQQVIRAARLPPRVRADVTGNALLLEHSADGIAEGQPRTLALAALAIFLLMAWSFRSWRLGLVAMVPNLVPVAMYFGALGFGAAPLSLPTSLIGSVALGIAVDDTVHFLVRYGRERRAGHTPEQAAALAGRWVGRPIALTSFMLIAGFGVIAFSSFATLRQFGVLSAGTMAVCLVADLILLPALLVRTRA